MIPNPPTTDEALIPGEDIVSELSALVDRGLLRMGVNAAGDSVFWATPLGEAILGMGASDDLVSM